MRNIPPRLITLTAFLIGYALIDDTNSTEQNLLGGFFMLIGQTLSTNASSQFHGEWTNNNNGQTTSNNQFDDNSMVNLLEKSRNVIDDQIKKMRHN